MGEIGKLYRAAGKVEDVFPNNGKKFTLEELQRFVGGNIEHVPHSRPFAFCNEDGRHLNLPFNDAATIKFRTLELLQDVLLGDVIQVLRGKKR